MARRASSLLADEIRRAADYIHGQAIVDYVRMPMTLISVYGPVFWAGPRGGMYLITRRAMLDGWLERDGGRQAIMRRAGLDPNAPFEP